MSPDLNPLDNILTQPYFFFLLFTGISIFDKHKKLVRSFHIEEIYRWGFKPNSMFYFEISVEDNADLGTGSLEFETTEGKAISDLLTDYAMAFLKEREHEEERNEKLQQVAKNSAGNGRSITPTKGKAATPPPAPASPPPAPAAKASTRPVSKRPSSTPTKSSTAATKAKEIKAATKMQALFRGYSLRNEWSREDAAILIQSVFRGYRARIALSEMIEEMIKAGEL